MKPVMNKKCIKIIFFPPRFLFLGLFISPQNILQFFLITAETTLNR